MGKVISYLRFSSAKQERGDSLRRQMAYAVQYAAEHRLSLDMHTYQDLGVSAYSATDNNVSTGAFGQFLSAVKAGIYGAGDTLIIESLDRMTRQDILTAQSIFLQIVNAGVTIYTAVDKQTYNKESILASNGIMLVTSLMLFLRANDESKTKSLRVKAAWTQKFALAADGKKLVTKQIPAWLTIADDGFIINSHAETVRQVFKLCADGLGAPAIARELNANAAATFSERSKIWSSSLITILLQDIRVAGHYAGTKADRETIAGYYPAVITQAEFDNVQALRANRSGGRPSKDNQQVMQLFAGRLKCVKCGASMRSISQSVTTAGICTYFKCVTAYSVANSCSNSAKVNYQQMEKAVITALVQQPDLFVRLAQADNSSADAITLREKLAIDKVKLKQMESDYEEFPSSVLARKMAELELSIDKAEAELKQTNKASVDYSAIKAQLMTALMQRQSMSTDDAAADVATFRRKMRDLFSQIIELVSVDSIAKTVDVRFKSGIEINSIEIAALARGFQKGNKNGKRE